MKTTNRIRCLPDQWRWFHCQFTSRSTFPVRSSQELKLCYEAAVSRGKTPSIESVDGTDFHVCYLPSVLGAILLAFEQNVYGNYVGFLHRVEKQLQSRWGLEEASGGTYTGAHCRYEPAFHFTKQELAFGPKSEDTETRLKYCRRPYQFCNQISDQSKGFEDRVSSAFPGYSIGRTF